MKKHDITKNIVRLHEEAIMKGLVDEVKEDLEKGALDSYKVELKQLLTKLNKGGNQEKSNVVSLQPNIKQKVLNSLHSVELLAAAGKSIDVWHSRPINFSDVGFTLDIRKVLDSSNEVELYLSIISGEDTNEKSKMIEAFSNILGSNINISIECDEIQLLQGSLYVDSTGMGGEGTGILMNQDIYSSVKGQLVLNILSEK